MQIKVRRAVGASGTDSLAPQYLIESVTQKLPGRGEPPGSPGGAAKIGLLGVDTRLVASLPRVQEASGA